MDFALNDISEINDCNDLKTFLNNVPNHIKLLCIHMNIRSIIKNFATLEQCIYSSPRTVDVIMLTEVNITNTLRSLYQLKGYRMYTELRTIQKGGGIIIYIKDEHNFITNHHKTKHCECLLGTLTTPSNYSAVLCCIYRPPRLSKHLFIKDLDALLRKTGTQNDMYLLGDINIDLRKRCPVMHEYSTTMYNHGLACGITDYTRIEISDGRLSKTCIDHIYARSRSLRMYTAALGTVLADHRIVALAAIDSVSSTREDFKCIRYDYHLLAKNLKEIDWEPIKKIICPLKIYSFIVENIKSCHEKAKIIIKKSKNKNRINNKWVDNKIIKACEYRDNLFMKWIDDPTNKITKQKYNKSRNYANKLINKTKNKRLRNEILSNKNNPRALWQTLNEITGRVKIAVDTVVLNAFRNNTISTRDIANKFADCFESSAKNIVPNCNLKIINKDNYASPINVTCRYQQASAKSVLKEIRSLNSRKAPGVDGITALDLKLIGAKIAEVISQLINSSIKLSKYPNELKTGIVRPIHKKGKQDDCNNYRPITILPTVDKVVEKTISKQIQAFYKENNVITDKQFGFQCDRSTTQLLSKFTDTINKHLDNKKHVLVAFIDYSRAFDTLKHNILLEKLNDCGVRGPLSKWCQEYLANRAFVVKVSNDVSRRVTVTDGTAQGSVLGPLHYITYVNDAVNVVKNCEIFQFADDTCLVAANKNLDTALSHLQSDFTLLSKWSHDSGLVINTEKTKCMYICSSQNRLKSHIKLIAHDHQCLHTDHHNCSCSAIDLVNKQKYLGLVIDDRFKWSEHVSYVCDKLRAILAKFSIIKHKIPYSILLSLYKALGETIIQYGLGSYGRTCKTHLDPIYRLQLRILKAIVPPKIKTRYQDNHNELFHHCAVLPIHSQVKYMLITDHFFNMDLCKVIYRNKQTRNAAKIILMVPRFTNLYGKQLLQYQVPKLINELPITLKQELNESNIKVKLKKYFLSTLLQNK